MLGGAYVVSTALLPEIHYHQYSCLNHQVDSPFGVGVLQQKYL